jgi:RNA polymerase sigma-70 factor (ECF subfamily)
VPDQADDRELMIRAAAGDRPAFAALVDRYGGRVFHLARALVRDDATAEDVARTLPRRVALPRPATAATARSRRLYAIARHAAHRRARRADQIATDDRSLEALGAAAGWGQPDVLDVVARGEDRAQLEAAMAALPDDDRLALWLHHVLDQTFDDTARVLGCSVAAVKSRLHRARLALAASLRQGGDHVAR